MSGREPQIRAVQCHSLLRAVRKLPVPERDEIFRRLGPSVLERLESLLPVAWAPMALHMYLSDIVRDVVGPERNVAVWRTTMASTLERPLFKGFVRMTADLFGITPSSFLRQGERIYDHLTKDLGYVRAWAEVTSGCVELYAFPADRFQFICYVEGLWGCVEATVALSPVPCSVRVRDMDEKKGNVSYVLCW